MSWTESAGSCFEHANVSTYVVFPQDNTQQNVKMLRLNDFSIQTNNIIILWLTLVAQGLVTYASPVLLLYDSDWLGRFAVTSPRPGPSPMQALVRGLMRPNATRGNPLSLEPLSERNQGFFGRDRRAVARTRKDIELPA